MCAVKFAYIGSNLNDLRTHLIEEKSYSPIAEVKNMSSEVFSKIPSIKEIAIVCTLNNKSGIVFEEGKFAK